MACRRVSTSRRSLTSRRIRVNWLPFSAPNRSLRLWRAYSSTAALELKFAQIRHLFAGHPGAQPLLGDGVLIFCPAKLTSRAWILRNFASASATKRVLQPFLRIRTSTCSPSPSGAKPGLPPPEIFRIGFQQPAALRLAVQPVSWSKAIICRPYAAARPLRRRSLPAAGEAQLLGGGRFHVDVVHMAAEIFSDKNAHLRDMRQHFRRWAIMVTSTLPSV